MWWAFGAGVPDFEPLQLGSLNHACQPTKLNFMASIGNDRKLPYYQAPLSSGAMGQRPTFGLLFVYAIPLFGGILPLLDVQIGQFSAGGFLWVLLLVIGVYTVLIEKAFHRKSLFHLPCMPWLVFLSVVWLSLFWGSGMDRRQIQVAAQLSLPVFIGLMSSMFVTNERQLKFFLRLFMWAMLLSLMCAGLRSLGALASEQPGLRPQAIKMSLYACVFLAATPPHLLWAVAGWGVCTAIAVFTGSRLATFTMLSLPIVHPLYRGQWLIRSIIIASTIGVGLWIFYTPAFQARFFIKGSGTVTDILEGDFNTAGRLNAWALLWEEVCEHPWIGQGAGSSMVFLQDNEKLTGMKHPHNDYLRITFETGAIGFSCFVFALAWQTWSVGRRTTATSGVLRHAYAAAFLGWCVLVMMSVTDNILIFTIQFMAPLFAITGAAYGVAYHMQQQEMQAERSTDAF